MLGVLSCVSNSPLRFLAKTALIAATDSGVKRGGACSCQDGAATKLACGVPKDPGELVCDCVTNTRP